MVIRPWRAFLSFWSPPRYLINCTQLAFVDDDGPLLIRNYDLDPSLNETTMLRTRWLGRDGSFLSRDFERPPPAAATVRYADGTSEKHAHRQGAPRPERQRLQAFEIRNRAAEAKRWTNLSIDLAELSKKGAAK